MESESTSENAHYQIPVVLGLTMCGRPKRSKLLATKELWESLGIEGPGTSEGRVVGLNKRIV